ncbi:hypothetical protein TURU_007128 [Turdus rufiventris]|nr:hypothetical protein TURU_007128 [Turdus rufiventris]
MPAPTVAMGTGVEEERLLLHAAAVPGKKLQPLSADWTVITVDLPNNSLDMMLFHMELDSEYFFIGDTAHTPLEIEVAPMTIKGSITCLILLACCPQPPFYLVEGQILAQAIPIPKEVTVDGKSLEVYQAEVVGEIEEGNRQADSLETPAEQARLPDIFQQAKLSHQQYHQNVPGLIHQFQLTTSQARAIVATCPSCQLQAMRSLEKTYLPLNPVMNPIQVVFLLTLNSLPAAWIVPQPHQNVWVTLAQTLQQENICLSTAAAENPMSTCLVGVPLKAGEYSASFATQMPNELPESHTIQSYKPRQQQAVLTECRESLLLKKLLLVLDMRLCKLVHNTDPETWDRDICYDCDDDKTTENPNSKSDKAMRVQPGILMQQDYEKLGVQPGWQRVALCNNITFYGKECIITDESGNQHIPSPKGMKGDIISIGCRIQNNPKCMTAVLHVDWSGDRPGFCNKGLSFSTDWGLCITRLHKIWHPNDRIKDYSEGTLANTKVLWTQNTRIPDCNEEMDYIWTLRLQAESRAQTLLL